VTFVTSFCGRFRPAQTDITYQYQRYRPAMITLLAFVAVIAVLAAALGAPYHQTWYSRWNPHR
jgi:hypothetical protein